MTGSRGVVPLLLCLAMIPGHSVATIYTCVDPVTNAVTYTNKRTKGCKTEKIQEVGGYTLRLSERRADYDPPSGGASVFRRASRGGARGKGDQLVPGEIQQKRDQTRRDILNNELRNEEKALEQAQKNLAESRKAQPGETESQRKERIQWMEGAVLDRQENIKALRQELSRL